MSATHCDLLPRFLTYTFYDFPEKETGEDAALKPSTGSSGNGTRRRRAGGRGQRQTAGRQLRVVMEGAGEPVALPPTPTCPLRLPHGHPTPVHPILPPTVTPQLSAEAPVPPSVPHILLG